MESAFRGFDLPYRTIIKIGISHATAKFLLGAQVCGMRLENYIFHVEPIYVTF